MSETKHTPLPWDLEIDRSTFGHLHIKRAGEPGAKAWITYFYEWRSGEEVAVADAELIVASVNARPKVEELLSAVNKLKGHLEETGEYRICRADREQMGLPDQMTIGQVLSDLEDKAREIEAALRKTE